ANANPHNPISVNATATPCASFDPAPRGQASAVPDSMQSARTARPIMDLVYANARGREPRIFSWQSAPLGDRLAQLAEAGAGQRAHGRERQVLWRQDALRDADDIVDGDLLHLREAFGQ